MNVTADTQAMMDTFKGDLLPELSPYVREVMGFKMLHHPLVVSPMLADGFCGHENRLYQQRVEGIAAHKADKAWERLVFCHERPYRTDVLHDLISAGSISLKTKRAWALISEVWTDSENVDENDAFWAEVWNSEFTRLAHTTKETKAFDALPDIIPVWHGLERRDRRTLGFSWTSSAKVGNWFAERFGRLNNRPAYLATGHVRKEHVKAYLLSRNEFEIIAFPAMVEGIKITLV